MRQVFFHKYEKAKRFMLLVNLSFEVLLLGKKFELTPAVCQTGTVCYIIGRLVLYKIINLVAICPNIRQMKHLAKHVEIPLCLRTSPRSLNVKSMCSHLEYEIVSNIYFE